MKPKVHPVAALFPMIQRGSNQWNELLGSIEENGQLDPIVMDGDILLDGRNRLAVCTELKLQPKTTQWRDLGVTVDQADWIFQRNMNRRHMTEDQIVATVTAYQRWQVEELNKEAKKRKSVETKTSPQKPETKTSPVKSDTQSKDSRSTVGRIAEAAKTSMHKARQSLGIAKAEEKGLIPAGTSEKVQSGELKLAEAAKLIPEKPKKARKAKPIDREKVLESFNKWLGQWKDKDAALALVREQIA